MQFVHQPLTWGFLLVLLPVLIHLINLVRRRRVKWAAMDFLLQSYRRHRKWIWLKQLLLLLARMAAVALLVAMLAQWVSRQQWLSLFGSSSTHHYILLDDSYSMSERTGGAVAFDQAQQALSRVVGQLMDQPSQQQLTLVRFSRAALQSPRGDAGATVEQVADFNAEIVDANFDLQLEDRRREMAVTQLSVGPRPALELVRQLVDRGGDETNVVYVVSDFRDNQWKQPAETRRVLRQLDDHCEAIHLIRCAKQAQPNLAITDLRPGDETQAAGVPLFMYVSVKNHGADPARRVSVQVRTTYFDPQVAASGEPGGLQGRSEEPPAVLIDEIPPGETVTQRVQVFFPQAGAHVVEAILPEDPVSTDNRRWYVLNLAAGEPVLVIDGSLGQRHAYYLGAVFQPGRRANSGVQPDVQTPSFLRDASPETLGVYRVIYLLDVDRLDDRAVENLEAYVDAGGGLAVFAGERMNMAHYNQRLYNQGEGLFPLPLQRDDVLPAEMFENIPDFEVEDHPIFSVFFGERNPFVRLVTVERYLRPPEGWRPDAESTVRVLARLRNQQPLAVEKQFGQGRVVVFLTTLAPDWNNWANDPSFVVVVLRLQSYLGASSRQEIARRVGMPIQVDVDLRQYRKDVTFVAPGRDADRTVLVEQVAEPREPDSELAVATLGGDEGDAAAETQRSGVYEVWSPKIDGPFDVRRFALNVDTDEGNLSLSDSASLRQRLQPVRVVVHLAEDYARDVTEQAGYNRGLLLMCLLIALLFGEQMLAYTVSYHPARST